ncbi:MFS transporter [Streptomyces xiamenensis]|uniref:Transporter, major facilitator family protein n=1 Tax=Streptomyces xiamenensis TaxID=408015 RepID=A0A0F7CMZ0_9ACTN|nr:MULTISPECIES: MFS transporter [Streptomyces]AKG41996.1 transporter, major facilitator family protein [Streptomyces xiamenensis]
MTSRKEQPLSDIRRWRAGLFVLFVIVGVSMSSWITRTPDIRDAIGASTAGMGLVIFGLSVGAMTGVLSSGQLVARFGGRPVTAAGIGVLLLGPLLVGIGAATGSAWLVFVALVIFGAGSGLMEIAVNIEGAAVERALSRSVLPALHGCFSAGTVVGAATGIALTAVDFSVAWHLWLVTALCAPAAAWAVRQLPAGTGREGAASTDEPRLTRAERLAVWREPRTLMLGAIVLGMALAEGAANDWLPLIMVDGYELNATTGSLVYTLFAAAMATGRFGGEFVLARLGRVTVVRGSAVLAAIGILVVVFAPHPALAAAAVVLWGLGASLGFPVTLSAAGDSPHHAAARVSAVATIAYLAFLAGPPLLGLLGEHTGLRHAMLAVAAVALLVSTLASAARRPRTPAGPVPAAPATAAEPAAAPVPPSARNPAD